jgi:hypothetical protein
MVVNNGKMERRKKEMKERRKKMKERRNDSIKLRHVGT